MVTRFYGNPDSSKRKDVWQLLQDDLKSHKNYPWLVMGDFNEIMVHDEKCGGRPHSEKLMSNFVENYRKLWRRFVEMEFQEV